MKKLDKKVLLSILLGIFISIMTSTLAETLIESKNVSYVDNSKLGATNVQNAIDGTCTKFSSELQNFLLKVYPIGSIYISYSNTNPSTLFGGVWEVFGKGQTLVGIDTSSTEFKTLGQTGGSKTVTLTEDNLPAHTHDISHTHTTISTTTSTMNLTANAEGSAHTHKFTFNMGSSWQSGDYVHLQGPLSGDWATTPIGGEHTHTFTGTVTIPELTTKSSSLTSGSTGKGTSFSTLDPYITVYMWKRTK